MWQISYLPENDVSVGNFLWQTVDFSQRHSVNNTHLMMKMGTLNQERTAKTALAAKPANLFENGRLLWEVEGPKK